MARSRSGFAGRQNAARSPNNTISRLNVRMLGFCENRTKRCLRFIDWEPIDKLKTPTAALAVFGLEFLPAIGWKLVSIRDAHSFHILAPTSPASPAPCVLLRFSPWFSEFQYNEDDGSRGAVPFVRSLALQFGLRKGFRTDF